MLTISREEPRTTSSLIEYTTAPMWAVSGHTMATRIWDWGWDWGWDMDVSAAAAAADDDDDE